MMAFPAEAVANEFLRLGGIGNVTPLQLQKLVYYAHAWYLALYDKELISEDVEFWPYGPVIKCLYDEFSGFGQSSIDRFAREKFSEFSMVDEFGNDIPDDIPDDEPDKNPFLEHFSDAGDVAHAKAHLKNVWDRLGKYNGVQLSNMTHTEDEPWSDLKAQNATYRSKIDNDLIKSCFKRILEAKSQSA